MQEKEIERLLRQAATCKNSFEELYERTQKMVHSFALCFVQNAELCKEIKQDVYVKILQGAGNSFRGGNVCGWLYTVTKNLALNALKKSKREVLTQSIEAFSPSVSMEDSLFLEQALSCLKDNHREIVVLRLIEDMSMPQIAQILHLPLTTVKWRYQAAIKHLRSIFKEI